MSINEIRARKTALETAYNKFMQETGDAPESLLDEINEVSFELDMFEHPEDFFTSDLEEDSWN